MLAQVASVPTAPMTISITDARASARSRPPSREVRPDRIRAPRTRAEYQHQAAAAATLASRWQSPPAKQAQPQRRGDERRQKRISEQEHGHQSRSSLELVQVGAAEFAAHPAGEDAEHDHRRTARPVKPRVRRSAAPRR